MRTTALLASTLLLATLLSGCGGAGDPTTTTATTLAAGKGGITGIVIDDRYRPVQLPSVLLLPLGLQVTADVQGQFQFTDLEPGSYELRIAAKDHEANPIPVDVSAGEFSEIEAMARRVFSDEGYTITKQYSVFIACSAEVVVYAGAGLPCILDASGDSSRTGFDTALSSDTANKTTYMVTEVLFNQKGTYGVVLGILDGTNTYETYYSEADGVDTTYVRIQNEAGKVNERTGENVGGRNVAWPPGQPFTTTIFPHGEAYKDLHEAGGLGLFGAGADLGVKAQILQTIFLGPPTVDLESYAPLKPA